MPDTPRPFRPFARAFPRILSAPRGLPLVKPMAFVALMAFGAPMAFVTPMAFGALMAFVTPATFGAPVAAVASPPVQESPAAQPPANQPTSPAAPSPTTPAEPAPAAPAAPTPPAEPAPAAPATPAKPIIAVFQCESGIFKVELATKKTPRLCANFINLANRGYFDGQKWGDFSPVVRQTGLNPAGEPSYTLPREFSKDLFFDKPGRLCFANNSEDPSSARAKPTRIFITVRPQDRWNLQYSAIGTITEGLDVATALRDGERIIRVLIEGDVSAHQARYAKQIAEWNAALDQVGLIDRR